jgi:sugar phosphate isomerase/epimerase
MSEWAVGLSTGCFYQTNILDCLEQIRGAGFNEIEICSFPAHLDYHDSALLHRAAQRIEELGLEAYSLHAPFAPHIDITSLDAGTRENALGEILRAAEAAAVLTVKHFVIHPGPEKGSFAEQERMRRMENAAVVLARASQRCRELGIHLVLENMLPHLFAGRVQDLLWILGAMDTVDVGVCVDTGHAYLAGELGTIARKLYGHLWMVHASDNCGQFDDHLAPGEGRINWNEFLHDLAAIQFRGTIILEIAGTGNSGSILQAAQRGHSHLRAVARGMSEPKHGMFPAASISSTRT